MADDIVPEPAIEPAAAPFLTTPPIAIPTLGIIVEALEEIAGGILPIPAAD